MWSSQPWIYSVPPPQLVPLLYLSSLVSLIKTFEVSFVAYHELYHSHWLSVVAVGPQIRLKSETAKHGGNWYWSDRSVSTVTSLGICSCLKLEISSCWVSYYTALGALCSCSGCSKAFISHMHAPHSLHMHAANRLSVFLQSNRYVLCGSVSLATLRGKFIWAGGS